MLFYGMIVTLPPPARHDGLLEKLRKLDLVVYPSGALQGFMTSTGRYVNRQEAFDVAKAAGQVVKGKFQPNTLFSEDLW